MDEQPPPFPFSCLLFCSELSEHPRLLGSGSAPNMATAALQRCCKLQLTLYRTFVPLRRTCASLHFRQTDCLVTSPVRLKNTAALDEDANDETEIEPVEILRRKKEKAEAYKARQKEKKQKSREMRAKQAHRVQKARENKQKKQNRLREQLKRRTEVVEDDEEDL